MNQINIVKVLFSLQYLLQYVYYVHIHAFQSKKWEILFLIVAIIDIGVSSYFIIKRHSYSLREVELVTLYVNFIFIANRCIADLYLLSCFAQRFRFIVDIRTFIIFFISFPSRVFAIIYYIKNYIISKKLKILHSLFQFVPLIDIFDFLTFIIIYLKRQIRFKLLYILGLVIWLFINLFVYISQIIIFS